jgi:hypothetical protein
MTDSGKIFSRLRKTFGRHDVKVAYALERQLMRAATQKPAIDARFQADCRAAKRETQSLHLGVASRQVGTEVWVAFTNLLVHALVVGATRSGKSYLTIAVAMWCLWLRYAKGVPVRLAVFDNKGELCELLDAFVADLVETLPPQQGKCLVDELIRFDPFSTKYVVAMQLLAREPGLDISEQAADVTSLLSQIAGPALGTLQDSILFGVSAIGIENGFNLLDVRRLLAEPSSIQSLAQQSSLEDVRLSLGTGTIRRNSLEGVCARIDRFLRLRSTQLMLSGANRLSFEDAMANGTLLFSAGSPPGGNEDVQKGWLRYSTKQLERSVFRRSHADASRPVLVLMDEFQESLSAGVGAAMDPGESFERLLTLAASRGVSLWLITQSLARVAKVASTLPSVIGTNVGIQLIGRASTADAHLLATAGVLPITGRRRRPAPAPWETQREPFLSREEEVRELARELQQLPRRSFYFQDRSRPYPAELVRIRDVTCRDRSQHSAELLERIARGAAATPIGNLDTGRVGIRQTAVIGATQPLLSPGRHRRLP